MTTFTPAGPPRFAHQRKGLRDIITSRGVHALLFEPGTGKTATTLDYASLLALKSMSGQARVLVIAPLAALDTWTSQAETFVAHGVRVHAEALGGSIRQKAEAMRARAAGDYRTGSRRALARVIRNGDDPTDPQLLLLAINFDAFASRHRVSSSKTSADLMVEAVRHFQPDLIVVDESHRIKSPTSNTSKAIARLTPLCRRRLILTGTVMPHTPLDVFAQWRFLDPTAFGTPMADGTRRPATFGGFRSRFARMGGWMGKEVLGFRNLDEMQDIMGQRATVVRKEDALDLPPVTDIVIPVHLSSSEQRAYDAMKASLAVQLDSGALASAPNRLAQLMRLRQITSGYLPDDAGVLTVLGDSKVRVIRSIVHDTLAGEHRVVVFAHFRHEIAALERALAEPGTEVLSITGDTPSADRTAHRLRFGSGDPARLILLAQVKTMSLAVNELVTASHAVFASLPNQRDDIEQARARLDRQGQTRPVTIWSAIAPRTVDDVLLQSYRDRTDLESAMLRHVRDGAV